MNLEFALLKLVIQSLVPQNMGPPIHKAQELASVLPLGKSYLARSTWLFLCGSPRSYTCKEAVSPSTEVSM